LRPIPNKSHTKIPSILDATMNQMQLGWILKNFTKNYNRFHLPNGGCYGECPFFIHHPNPKTWHLHCLFSFDGASKFILNLHVSFLVFITTHVLERIDTCQEWSCILSFFLYVIFCNHWALSLVEVSMCNIKASFQIDHMMSTSIWWTLEMEAW
jgi:hypothetical protein